MSCSDGPIRAGQDVTFEIKVTNIYDCQITCGSSAVVDYTLTDLGGGRWSVTVFGSEIVAPGPLKVMEGTTQHYCAVVTV